ncbi:helix-turn-helix transcriptional regulator [Nitrincola tapanii]|uniref:AraC family transcriptional regulator n=1 Tax=Nitrincola tapanii TaxID=1708751 RepID=A0A5A9VYV7_9GAMM|nr:AraC family transcriptional regulator [Nitrincola tapanii]KAA0873573.1 AraC family transcriptional regulator [Nitrincola tapanii]
MNKIITPDELPLWVPGDMLSSSKELGWKDISQRSYYYKGQEVPIPALDHFMIVSYHKGLTPMYRRIEESTGIKTTCSPSDISLLSNSQNSYWDWTEDIIVSHIYLSNQFMSRIATEITEKPIENIILHDILQLRDPLISSIVECLNNEVRSSGLGGSVYAEALGIQLAVHLLRNYANLQFKESTVLKLSKSQEKIIREYINTNLHKNIKIEDLSNQVGMGVWNFSKRFKQSFHCSPHVFLTRTRADKAKKLICEGDFAIKEIAYLCGFSDQAHLTRTLSKIFGITPKKLRNL